ncbi:MAG: hypothetical protein KatS3mg099_243 [Candidatus Parcubacteria bacterium]|nr:MAG: hypothetical protein KatS3mg099_243 [Candidatus Parcubacteria bacterium]
MAFSLFGSQSPLAARAARSQEFVPIKEIHDGVVVLDGGGLRGIFMCSSTNFALKSHDEQMAILSQFARFLDSLDFSVQLFVQSRKLDIRPYLATLEERYYAQKEELMKLQVREYISFIRSLTENTNIMSKHFFAVVPYDPPLAANMPLLGGLGKSAEKTSEKNPLESRDTFEEYRLQLEQRMDVVAAGLGAASIRVTQLGTEELIELFYQEFNVGELERPVQIT